MPDIRDADAAADADRVAVLDAETDAAELGVIAGRRPDLGALIAAHPNVYDQLLGWLAEYGGEDAREAVSRRRAADAAGAQNTGPIFEPAGGATANVMAAPQAQLSKEARGAVNPTSNLDASSWGIHVGTPTQPDAATLGTESESAAIVPYGSAEPSSSAVKPRRNRLLIGGLIAAAVVVIASVGVAVANTDGYGAAGAQLSTTSAPVAGSGAQSSTAPSMSPTPTRAQTGTFTFDCLDRICLGMTVDQFVSAFPQSRVWPWKTKDPSFGPGELFSQVVAAPGSPARSGRACTVIGDLAWEKAGTLLEVQFERGVVVAVVKIGDPAKRNVPAEFTTNGGLTGFSSLQSFRSEFGDVFIAADENGRGRWVLRGPNGRTMQIGRTAEGKAAAIGLMDGQHSMRFLSFHAEACGFMHNGAPDFS